jgi:polyhydroxybutyrate depolymerase
VGIWIDLRSDRQKISVAIECQMGDLFRAVAPMSGLLWSGSGESESKVASIMMREKMTQWSVINAGKKPETSFLVRIAAVVHA